MYVSAGRLSIFFAFIVSCSFVFSLASCEKEVNIDLNTGPPKLVIEGQIENDGFPFVVLTKSVGYFSTIDLSLLENNFVHGAVIKVSDGIKTVTLKEYSLDTGVNNLNKFYFYSIDFADTIANKFTGITEKYYSLTVEYEGKTYESITKIPSVRGVDSMWFQAPKEQVEVPDAVILVAKFTDPDTPGNFLRYFTRRNNEFFLPGISSVYPDDLVNGTTIDSLVLEAGYNRSKNVNRDSLGYFFKGDTVTLKWCSIDKSVYDFYRTYEYATGTIGNPFASPVSVLTNIKGGALGIWAGYGAKYKTAVVPK
jgi:hypothetical protein